MNLTSIAIKDFRCIQSLRLPIRGNAVIIGENNAGKSAVLDAVKIALGRRWGKSGNTGFNEYDFRTTLPGADSKQEVIEVTLGFAEKVAHEWPENITGSLLDITQTDPKTALNAIEMRVRCKFAEVTKSVEPEWQFLNSVGDPYAGKGARNQNLSSFFDYVPCFSMGAMRDASVEFGGRSRFWGSLLKSIDIDKAKSDDLEGKFAALNTELLAADPKLESIKNTLRSISNVIAIGAAGNVDVRAVPINLWDIISRSELIVQGKAADPWLPIGRHGNGVQSLAVMFLFRAYIENMLEETYTADSTPILTLEEPEAHLHPQACRALWESVVTLPGQKIITTHSPYFVQNVPLKDLIILRRGAEGPKGYRIEQIFSTKLSNAAGLNAVVTKYPALLSYDEIQGVLTCQGVLEEATFRELLMCFVDPQNATENHAALRKLKDESINFVGDDEIGRLESWAKRIRGEIFFARKWILCEGQSEYAILGAIGEKLGVPLDAYGISVIDYQNNGSSGAFATLARAFGFEWAMICDGDQGGDDHIAQLLSKRFLPQQISDRVVQLPKGQDLEQYLIGSTFRPLMVAAIHELDGSVPDTDADLLAFAADHKEETAVRLARNIRLSGSDITIPPKFTELFKNLGEIA